MVAAAQTPSIAYVQSNYSAPQSSQESVTVQYRAQQTAGDLNVIVVGWNQSTAKVKSVTDSNGNTYSLALGPTMVRGALSQSIYFAKNIAAAAANENAVTVTFSAAVSYPDVRILEYSGADQNKPLDATASNSGSSSTSSDSIKTVNPTDLLFAANMVRTVTAGPGSGFTQRVLSQPDGDIAEDDMVTTSGNYTATAPLNQAGAWIMQVVAFRTPVQSGADTAALTPSALSCTNSSMTGAGTDVCTVALSNAAPSGGQIVNLSSSSTSVSVPSSVTVATGATSATFSATLSAVSAAQTVKLTASAGNVSQTFTLQLNAAPATLSINSTSISFGDVNLNTTATQSLTLTSSGGSPVTVSSATISGTGFSISGATFPITLSSNQSATLSVQFDPTTAGSVTGELTISSNSSTKPSAGISLSGTGSSSSYSVSVTWLAPASSSDPVAGYHIYRSPSGSSSYQLLSSVSNTALSYTDSSVQGGQTYDYIVESVDASGVESVPSNMASASVP